MIIKCETTKIIHSNENFQLVSCIPIGEYDNIVVHPQYHTATIKDPMHRLVERKQYTLDISELPPNKYGQQYLLVDIPSLSFDNIDDISEDMELELLCEIMTPRQAQNVHKAYPDFIKRVLQGEKIDTSMIYNVSQKRMEQYTKKVYSKYNSFLLHARTKHFNLTPQECTRLFNMYNDIEECVKQINAHPYHSLISICGRGFRRADVEILHYDIDYKYSTERIEYMLNYAIEQFENDGSTYVDAVRLGEYIYTIDIDVVPSIRDVAINSELIHYDSDRNILMRESTYNAEKRIADFLKAKSERSHILDWDWSQYKKIKDGELTEEQQSILKMFCKHNVCILDAPSGTGKTSSLMALIQMIEDNGMTYIMMSPTGKAASRLSEQTGRPASTIHRAVMSNMLIDKDVIIIDEASMVSVPILDMVVESELLDTCRILFVGDSAQIPSIGLGRVFKDMGESGIIPTATLTRCFRFEDGGASYISTLTRQGEFYITDEQLNQDRFTLGTKEDYEFIKFDGTVEQIVDTYMDLVNSGIAPQDIMLLVPYNIGNFGATKLNNLIQERLNPIGKDLFMKTKHNDTDVMIHTGDLVMNIKNNYNALSFKHYNDILFDEGMDLEDANSTSVFNGQIGKVVSVTNETELIRGKMLVANIEGEDIIYTTSDINNLLLSYASNPYKFQGSQCKYVINVVIGAHERVWNRQLLYTAQTRMTTKLIEIGDPNVIDEAIKRVGDDKRNTMLKELLRT